MLTSAAVSAQSMAVFGLVELGLTVAVIGYRGIQERRAARRRVSQARAERDAVPVLILDSDASPRHFIVAGVSAPFSSTKPTFTAPSRA